MNVEELNYYKRLERDRRRPLGQAAHPDDCPKLRIRGVAWAVPPRGVRVAPRFCPGGLKLAVTEAEDWPELTELREAVRALQKPRRCRRCGQVIEGQLGLRLPTHRRVLELAFAAAARALRAQYDLSDEELADLLAIAGPVVPRWFEQIVRYSCGLDLESSRTPIEGTSRRSWLARLLGR